MKCGLALWLAFLPQKNVVEVTPCNLKASDLKEALQLSHLLGRSLSWKPHRKRDPVKPSAQPTHQLNEVTLIQMCCVVLSHSVESDSATSQTVTHRLLCPWGFSRPEYWSGLPCPPPGDLPNPGIEPRSPTLQTDSLPSEPPEKPQTKW